MFFVILLVIYLVIIVLKIILAFWYVLVVLSLAFCSLLLSLSVLLSGSVWKTRDQIARKMDMFDCRMQDW